MSCEPDWKIGFWNVETGRRLKVPGELGEQTDVTHHNLLPDGRTLLTYKPLSKELALWNLRTGKKLGVLAPDGPGINPSVLSRDGTTFAVGRKKVIWVYDVPSRTPVFERCFTHTGVRGRNWTPASISSPAPLGHCSSVPPSRVNGSLRSEAHDMPDRSIWYKTEILAYELDQLG